MRTVGYLLAMFLLILVAFHALGSMADCVISDWDRCAHQPSMMEQFQDWVHNR